MNLESLNVNELLNLVDMLTAGDRTEAAKALGVSKATASSYRRMGAGGGELKTYYAKKRAMEAVLTLARAKGVRFE